MIIAVIPLIFAIIGLLMWVLAGNPIVKRAGEIIFFCAFLALMFAFSGKTISIGALTDPGIAQTSAPCDPRTRATAGNRAASRSLQTRQGPRGYGNLLPRSRSLPQSALIRASAAMDVARPLITSFVRARSGRIPCSPGKS